MKIEFSMKTPDCLYDIPNEYSDEVGKWLRYGEYLDLVYDTETKVLSIVKPSSRNW